MQRGSDKHSAREDDALARDVESMLRGTGHNHAQEWKDPKAPANDDPSWNGPPSLANKSQGLAARSRAAPAGTNSR